MVGLLTEDHGKCPFRNLVLAFYPLVRIIFFVASWSHAWSFTPKSDQFQISPEASTEILRHSMKNLAFHSLLRLKDYHTTNSH